MPSVLWSSNYLIVNISSLPKSMFCLWKSWVFWSYLLVLYWLIVCVDLLCTVVNHISVYGRSFGFDFWVCLVTYCLLVCGISFYFSIVSVSTLSFMLCSIYNVILWCDIVQFIYQSFIYISFIFMLAVINIVLLLFYTQGYKDPLG